MCWETVQSKRARKTDSEDDCVTCDDKLFQTRAAATERALSPSVEWRVDGMMSADEYADPQPLTRVKIRHTLESGSKVQRRCAFKTAVNKHSKLVLNPLRICSQ